MTASSSAGRRRQQTLVTLCTLIAAALAVGVQAAYKSPVGGTAGTSQPICSSHWQSIGPFAVQHVMPSPPNNDPTDPDDIGAAHDIWVSGHSAYLATVNGGVWRTATFHTMDSLGGPHWQPVTDQMPCLSMSAISGSVNDPTVLIAGCGFQSNAAQRGGEPRGAMISLDSGATWTMTGFPKGYWVSSVLAAGIGANAVLLVSARAALIPTSVTGGTTNSYNIPSANDAAGGIWRSTDAGLTFASVFSTPVNRMVRHPTTASILYAVTLVKASAVQMSTDGGLTWGPPALQPDVHGVCGGALVRNPQITVNDVGGVTTIVVGFYVADDQSNSNPCYALFFSKSNGATWTTIINPYGPMDALGLGEQGLTNFAILLAPTSANALFVSGTGRVVMRVDITTSVWTLFSQPLIDPQPPGDRGTSTPDSAPHSDARNFFWDTTTGELLLTNDGGIYKRTNPLSASTAGGWSSLAGDLSITEAYQVSVDPATGAMMVAAQDNSLLISQWDGRESTTGIWSYLLTADGTVTGFDSTSSSFYGSNQALGGLLKAAVLGGTLNTAAYSTFSVNPGGNVLGDGAVWAFATTLAVNLVAPARSLVCTQPSGTSVCYDLQFGAPHTATALADSSTSLSSTPAGTVATQYVYGGRRGGSDFPDVVFAVGQNWVWARTSPGSSPSAIAAPWQVLITWAFIAQHPRDYYINLVIDDVGHCWLTTDFGQTFKDLNLPANSNLLALSEHTSVDTFNTGAAIFIDSSFGGVYPLVIGTTFGSFVSFDAPTSASFTFKKLGVNLAKTIPTSYVYSGVTDTLTASLFGRGVWQLQSVAAVLAATQANTATSTISPGCTTPLYPNVPTCFGYNPFLSSSTGISSSSSAAASSSSSSSSSSSAASSSSTAASSSSSAMASSSSTATLSSSTGASSSTAPSSSSTAAASSTAASSSSSSSTGTVSSSSTAAGASTGASSSTGAVSASTGSSSSSTGVNATSSSSGAASSSASSSSSTGSGLPPATMQPEMIVDFPSSMASGSSVDVTLRLPSAPSSAFTMTLSLSAGSASPSSLQFTTGSDALAWFRLHTFRFTAPSISSDQVVTFQAQYSSPEYLALSRSIQVTATSQSSSTGGGGDSSSSTGGADSSVPALFPVLEVHFNLSVRATAPDPAALLRLMMSDSAAAAGVALSRLVQLTFVQGPNSILFQFSIAPPPILSLGEISAQQAATNFLALSNTGSTAHLSYATYAHSQVVDLADAAQQNLASKLSQVTFSMSYGIDALPGGATAFEANLVRDIALASKVANSSRIVLTSLVADPFNPSGSVRATFLVAPVFIASQTDITPSVAIDNFLAAASNPASDLFTGGTVTGQTAPGSASVTWPVAPAAAESSEGFWTLTMIIIIAACGAGFLLLLLILYCVFGRKKPQAKSPQPQSRKGFDSIAVINDEPTTMQKKGTSNGSNGSAKPVESAADGGDKDGAVELAEIRTDKTDSASTPSSKSGTSASGTAAASPAPAQAQPAKEPVVPAVDPAEAQAARVAAARATLESGEHVSPGVTAAKPAPPVAKIGAVPVRPSASGRPAVRTHPMPTAAAASPAAAQPAARPAAPASPPIRAHSPSPVVHNGVPTRPANARPTPIRATSTSYSAQPGSSSPLASPSWNASSPPTRSGLGSPSMGATAYPPQRPPMLPQQSQPYPQRPPLQPQSSVPVRPSSPQQSGFSPPIRGPAPAGAGQASSFRIAYAPKQPANPSAMRRLPPPQQ